MVLHCLIFMGLLRYSKLGTWLSTLLEQAAMKAWNGDWDTEPSQTRHCKCNANFEFLLYNPSTLLFWCHFLCFFNLWQRFHLVLVEQCFYNLWKAIGLSSCWTGVSRKWQSSVPTQFGGNSSFAERPTQGLPGLGGKGCEGTVFVRGASAHSVPARNELVWRKYSSLDREIATESALV